jgi:AGZA family xanthine/uracil permease-like MFS transporter
MQKLRFAYAPALIAVGVLMIGTIRHFDFDDLTELVPAFLTITVMVFTYNIGNGLTAGLLLHPILKTAAGRAREVNTGSIALAAICLLYYVFGLPH